MYLFLPGDKKIMAAKKNDTQTLIDVVGDIGISGLLQFTVDATDVELDRPDLDQDMVDAYEELRSRIEHALKVARAIERPTARRDQKKRKR